MEIKAKTFNPDPKHPECLCGCRQGDLELLPARSNPNHPTVPGLTLDVEWQCLKCRRIIVFWKRA